MAIPVDTLSAPLSLSAFFFYLDARVLLLIGRCVQPYLLFSLPLLLRGFISFVSPIFSLLLNF